jgi:hypothetical protein
MRKAALLLITLAVFGYPIVVTDIDGEKTVVMLIDDTRDPVRVDPAEVTPLPIPVLVIDSVQPPTPD